MKGTDEQQGTLYSYICPEDRIPGDHPLRATRVLVDRVLEAMRPELEKLYSPIGRPSIPPERLLRALLLQVLYTIRSERLLMEQMDYNLLFRWFVGLNMDDPIWDATVFSHNRDRLLAGEIAEKFLTRVLAQARAQGLLSDEHFAVDGTLIEAWAGQKSFRPKASEPKAAPEDTGNPTVDFRGQRRTNDTHQSTTDPDARLYKKAKGHEAKLSYLGHVLIEHRNGLVVNALVTKADGTAEREAAREMVQEMQFRHRATLGADKHYDTADTVGELRQMAVTPHVAQNTKGRSSAIDGRTTRHAGYALSQQKRKRVEEVFGWLKTIGTMRKVRHRGLARVHWMFTFAAAAYNLVRMRNLLAAPA